jgi:tetratricopeptide (TPR) repeat protein
MIPLARLLAVAGLALLTGCASSRPGQAIIPRLPPPGAVRVESDFPDVGGPAKRPDSKAADSVAEASLAEALGYYAHAIALQDQRGKPRQIVGEVERALAEDPGRLSLRVFVAASYLATGNCERAVALMEEGCRLAPTSTEARLVLASAYQAAGKPDKAAGEYRRIIRQAPRKADTYIRLAMLFFGLERHRDVLKVLDEGLRRVAEPLDLLVFCDYLVRAYIQNQQPKHAIECLNRIQARQPDNSRVDEYLARCYAMAGDRPRAIAIFKTLADRQPDNMLWHYYLGDLFEEQEEREKAAEQFALALKADPGRPELYVRLAALQLGADPALAMRTIREGLEKLPDEPVLYTFAGVILNQGRRFKEALAAFEQAERAAAQSNGEKAISPLFCFWYGSACEQDGQFDRAVELFERSIELFPDVHASYNYVAYMWAERGIRLDKALQYAIRALELSPDDPAYLDTLGWIYFKKGKYPKALAAIRKAAGLLPDDPTIAEHLGDVYKAMGNTRRAVACWQRSLQINPSDDELRRKLKDGGVEPAASPSSPSPPRDPEMK